MLALTPRFIRALALGLLGATSVSLLAPSTAAAARGRWTPTLDQMGNKAVHMVLVPGTGTEHSRVLWWPDGNNGRVYTWNPDNDDCMSAPLTGFTAVTPWSPGANIFCSGHTQLSGAEGGQLLTVGGASAPVAWGLRDSRLYAVGPGPGTWAPTLNPPRWPRWYPSATTLRDSRVLACSGNKGEQTWYFGGRRDDQPPASGGDGDLLHRFGRVQDPGGSATGGYWEDPLTPAEAGGAPPKPVAREGHGSAFLVDRNAQAFFGGRDGGGNLIDDQAVVWLLQRQNGLTLAADYRYQWQKLNINPSSPLPGPRREHTVVAISNTELMVFGGLRNPDGLGEAPTDQLWRLFKNQNEWHWQLVEVFGTPPSARYGHAAVYVGDSFGNRRIIVFGGSEQLNQAPTDSRVWAFNVATSTWSELAVASGEGSQQPLPRRDHTMVLDPDYLLINPNPPTSYGSLVLYGGDLGPGGPSDELWTLDLRPPPNTAWSRTIVSPSPGARMGHAAVYDNATVNGRMFLYGGEPAVGGPYFVYMIEPFGAAPQWNQWQDVPFTLSQHTANLDRHLFAMARIPEIYTPGGNWTPAPAAAWLQDYYPVQFLVPGTSLADGGGRVVTVGPDPQARYLDVPVPGVSPGGWLEVGIPPSNGDAQFRATSGVLYQPNKIMIAGGKETSSSTMAVGTTKWLDTDNLAAGWMGPDDMLPRYFHNLVALPTGEVLAVGGMTVTSDQATDPNQAQVCPQLWSPTSGTWTEDLACDRVDEGTGLRNVVRNYHSTAILLPDGRVLSAGGEREGNPDRTKARVFCPPYLFRTDGVAAQRPVIGEWPRALSWRDTFTICTANPTLIQKVSLVRPAATTHSFDQNQRYVPLDILERRAYPAQLVVRAPASPDSAPPGNYLLFILGSQDGDDVPSLARWVNIGCGLLCDPTAPAANTDLFIEIVSESAVYPTWVATGDDGTAGSATRYDLRRSTQPITTGNFASATRIGLPPPLCPGWPEFQAVGGLSPCTTYYFAFKTGDGIPNWSAISNVAQATTIGTGSCGGGGFSARQVEAEEGTSGSVPAVAGSGMVDARLATSEASLEPASASAQVPGMPLVVETRRDPDGAWQVAVRIATEADGLDPDATGVTVEQTDPGGGQQVLGRIEPQTDESLLGLCSLRERGRVAIPGVFALEQVSARLRHRDQDYTLADARHSRLGPLGAGFLADGGSPELLAGDVLDLTYAPARDPEPAAASWYLLVRRQGSAPPIPFSHRPSLGESVPSSFALHPSEPNPAASDVVIRFDLPVERPVTLEVFDLLGRRVATLADRTYPAGTHAATWDLRDASGTSVRPGVYVYRISAGEFRAKGKVSVLP